jgi:hypothetical protein
MTNTIIEAVLALLTLFFKNNPTVAEIEAILPEIITAIASAKSGQAFSVQIPLSVDAVKGAATFAWSPGATNTPPA